MSVDEEGRKGQSSGQSRSGPSGKDDDPDQRVVHINELLSDSFGSRAADVPMAGLGQGFAGIMPSRRIAEALRFGEPSRSIGDRIFSSLQEQSQERARKLLAPLRAAIGGSFTRHFEGLLRRALPPNLREIGEQINVGEVLEFLKNEGIPLYLVPRASVGLRLLKAPTRQARRRVLNDRFHAIVEDCATLLETCSDPLVETEVHFVQDGLGALRGGNYASAQAMFTLTLDSLIQGLHETRQERQAITLRRKGPLPADALKDRSLIEAYVWLPSHNAHEEFWADKGDKVPHYYSRHASVHAVSKKQFTKRNCVQSLMLVTSLIGYVDRAAKRLR